MTLNCCATRGEEEESPLCPKLWPRLRLASSGLQFGRSQLARLNLRLAALLHAEQTGARESENVERARGAVEQAIERLVQRLLCVVGDLDARFASKFLVTLHGRNSRTTETKWPGRRFQYIVRLDALSWPPLYPASQGEDEVASRAVEGDDAGALPAGWTRVRPTPGMHAQKWAEFLSPSGCLRRDRVIERFAVLLSQAVVMPPSQEEVDESRLCGAPGKVLDAGLVQYMLNIIPPEHQLFCGLSETQRSRPPDPRDYQLAVVHEDGSGPVLLRVGVLSPALQVAFPRASEDDMSPSVVEVQLHVAVALGGWPRNTNAFPARLPIHHPLALLAYQVAQQGFYAVAISPSVTLRCEERRSAWQIQCSGAELDLSSHFSATSTPYRVLTACRLLLGQLKHAGTTYEEHTEDGLHTVSDRLVRCLVWRQLEQWTSLDSWEPASFAAHVLLCLDALLAMLRARHAPDFFLPDANLLVFPPGSQFPPDQEEAWENAMAVDAVSIADCLSRLHAETELPQVESAEGERRCAALEGALLARWRSALNTASPVPPNMVNTSQKMLQYVPTRVKDITSPRPEHFSHRQLDYIAQVVRELMRFRKASFQHQLRGTAPGVTIESQEGPMEDFLFLLRTVLEQTLGSSTHVPPRSRHRRSRDFDKQQAWRDSIADAVRRDSLPSNVPPGQEELALVRHLILWLGRAAGSAPRALKPKLSRFVSSTWAASREGAWHLPEWRRRHEEIAAEIRALSAFCSMLLLSKEGWTGVAVLRDAAEKGWQWARTVQTELLRSGSLQLVLTPAPGVVRRCDVSLALQPGQEDRPKSRTLPAKSRQQRVSQDELTMRLGRGLDANWLQPSRNAHQRLRDMSPLTTVLDSRRRYGQQHALGNLVHAFIAMHRFSILQEVAALLPPAERQPVLDALSRLSRARRLMRHNRPYVEDPNAAAVTWRYKSCHEEQMGMTAEYEPATLPPRVGPAQISPAVVDYTHADSILGSCHVARTLQRRHSLFSTFTGELEASLPLLHAASPASVRRRYRNAGAGSLHHGVSVLHLGEGGEITLVSEMEQRNAKTGKTTVRF